MLYIAHTKNFDNLFLEIKVFLKMLFNCTNTDSEKLNWTEV